MLSAFAARVITVGDAGRGQAMKLAVNLVVHDLNSALSESLRLAEGAGIDPATAYDVLESSAIGAPFVHYKRAAFLDEDQPVAMSLGLVAKDLRLIAQLADRQGAPVPVSQATAGWSTPPSRRGSGRRTWPRCAASAARRRRSQADARATTPALVAAVTKVCLPLVNTSGAVYSHT